jgi:hypothetical protein
LYGSCAERNVFYSETLISNILLEISWVAVFSFEAKLLLSTSQDKFAIALQAAKNCSCRAMANLSWIVLSKSFASNEKTATQLISNRILDINVSL